MFKPLAICLYKGFKNAPVSMRDMLAFLAESIYGKRLVSIIIVSVMKAAAGKGRGAVKAIRFPLPLLTMEL